MAGGTLQDIRLAALEVEDHSATVSPNVFMRPRMRARRSESSDRKRPAESPRGPVDGVERLTSLRTGERYSDVISRLAKATQSAPGAPCARPRPGERNSP